MNKIRVLICDDNILYRSGINNFMKDEPGIIIVGEAENGYDLIKKYELLKPDLVITDITMPLLNGTEAVKKLRINYPGIKVIFLSILQGEMYIYYVIKVGARGLISKNIAKEDLVFAINEVYTGRNYFGHLYDEEKIKEIIEKYSRLNKISCFI